jgi:hypothetical protein
MSTLSRGDVTIGEWLVGGCVVITAVVAGKPAHLAPKWQDALVYTVIVFTGVLIALRPAWHKAVFWAWFLPIFLAHTLAIYFITRALPPASEGLQGLLLILSVVAEGKAIVLLFCKIFGANPWTGKAVSEPR